MMDDRRWPWVVSGFLILLVGGGLGHLLSEHPSYPLGVWRMDLDDALSNLGLFLAGLAAFLTVFRKAGRAEHRAAEVEGQFNGGLQKLAEELMRDEMETAGLSQTTLEMDVRIEALEAERNQCRDELAQMRATLRQMGDT